MGATCRNSGKEEKLEARGVKENAKKISTSTTSLL
jgi:hypothetical protein